MSEPQLWRLVAGRTTGPYDPAKLRPLMKDGRIGPLDRFSYDGGTWLPASEFPELLDAPAPRDAEARRGDEAIDIGPPRTLPRRPPTPATDDVDTARLMKVLYWVIGAGGAAVLLLVVVLAVSVSRGDRPRKPEPVGPKAAAAANEKPAAEPAEKPAAEPQGAPNPEPKPEAPPAVPDRPEAKPSGKPAPSLPAPAADATAPAPAAKAAAEPNPGE